MTQITPQHLDAMRLRKTLAAAKKKIDLSEKLIADLQKPPKMPLPEDHTESPPPADKNCDNPFSMAFLNDLWQNISKAGPSRRSRPFRDI
jgi:hypothetical protein